MSAVPNGAGERAPTQLGTVIAAGALVLCTVVPYLITLPKWFGVILQVGVTILGIVTGFFIQRNDALHKSTAAAKIAQTNVVAMAQSIRSLRLVIERSRELDATDPPNTAEESRRLTRNLLSGVDGHLDSLSAQVSASSDAWSSLVPESQSFIEKQAREALGEGSQT
jgi:hypothetical protein